MPETCRQCPDKQDVIGVGISTTSYQEVLRFCRKWVLDCRVTKGQTPARVICVTSVHGVITARSDHELRRILNTADIATPDGMPLVWALRSFGSRRQERVYGPELMLRLCEDAARFGHRIFLYGGREETLTALQKQLRMRFPNLRIAGAFSPPFRDLTAEEDEGVDRMIRESGADIVFVGISTPRQERWMESRRKRHPGMVMVGVGAAFDFHAGRVRQAPPWIQQHGLEWLFRLAMEPRRLWRRYLLVTPRFLPLWAMQFLSGRPSGESH